jgi:hypothetical protein
MRYFAGSGDHLLDPFGEIPDRVRDDRSISQEPILDKSDAKKASHLFAFPYAVFCPFLLSPEKSPFHWNHYLSPERIS